jgi:hypothetical protein
MRYPTVAMPADALLGLALSQTINSFRSFTGRDAFT